MTRHWNAIVRKTVPALSAGLLLQAGGCDIADPNTIAQGLFTTIANNVISSFVFGVFNIPFSGF